MNQSDVVEHDSREQCPNCDGHSLIEQVKEQSFAYGSPGDQANLTASMPVFTCKDCGYEFFDERGEAARHAAVCRHLGVHTPEEIRHVRESSGLSRAEFCQLTGFGSASLQRWEAGLVVPSASSDRLIFLLRNAENVEQLRRRMEQGPEETLSWSVVSRDHVTETSEGVPVVRTRCAVKRFNRLARQPRIAFRSATWSLRRDQCT